jgi:hypothetical protein
VPLLKPGKGRYGKVVAGRLEGAKNTLFFFTFLQLLTSNTIKLSELIFWHQQKGFIAERKNNKKINTFFTGMFDLESRELLYTCWHQDFFTFCIPQRLNNSSKCTYLLAARKRLPITLVG